MNFLTLARERYSVRKFKGDKVEQQKLDLILAAGQAAPTAVNYQPQRILVLSSEENLNLLKTITPYHFNAPLVLAVCYDKGTCWKNTSGHPSGEVDASIITDHMMLEAASLGLGSTWVGHFDHKAFIEAFNIPDFLVPVALLPIGYPAEDSKPHPLHAKRFDIGHTVFHNSFSGVKPGELHESRH